MAVSREEKWYPTIIRVICLYLLFISIFRRMKENPVEHVRDIMVQEIMNIEASEFENEAIDMDAISFASK